MATLDLGKIKLVWRGTYNNGTAYTVDDVVEYTDGGILSSYVCVTNSTGNAPSSGGTAHASWNYMTKGAVSGGFTSKQIFSSAGTHTYTKPSGITQLKVYVTGGGASGGGGGGDGDDYGGGGGAGGTAIKYLDATSINTVTVTIGSGGGGVSGSNAGNGGGTSSFGSHCSANGGYTARHGNQGQVRGGAGGAGTGGDINMNGQAGDGGHDGLNTTHSTGGTGGSSFFSGGGTGLASSNNYSSGHNGLQGAGGGGANYNGTSGAGGNGFCLVEEFK